MTRQLKRRLFNRIAELTIMSMVKDINRRERRGLAAIYAKAAWRQHQGLSIIDRRPDPRMVDYIRKGVESVLMQGDASGEE